MNEPKGFRGFIHKHNLKIFYTVVTISSLGNLYMLKKKSNAQPRKKNNCSFFVK